VDTGWHSGYLLYGSIGLTWIKAQLSRGGATPLYIAGLNADSPGVVPPKNGETQKLTSDVALCSQCVPAMNQLG